MPYTRRRRASSTGRKASTARRFLARSGREPTTHVEHQSLVRSISTANQNGVWRYSHNIVPGNSTQVKRIGGLKGTFRFKPTGDDQQYLACVGLVKFPDTNIPYNSGDVIPDPRRVFGKETWWDVGGHAPTLVQRSLRGMLTLGTNEILAACYLMINAGVPAGQLLLYYYEWSQRETSTG